MSPAKFPVAVVGVGNMGGAMAANLLEQAWPVRVSDIDANKVRELQALGALSLESTSRTQLDCQALIVCVVDAEQTEQLLFGRAAWASRLRPGTTVLLCPTLAPQAVEALALRLNQRGLYVIDAPMSGGPIRARDGSMSLMLACDNAVFSSNAALLAALSSRIFRVSERIGDGARTKLVNNLLAAINLVGAAEALALAKQLGLDMGRTLNVIEHSSGQSWIGSDRMRRALVGDFEPRAHVSLLEKDTRLALQAAVAVGFKGPLGAAARDVFTAASAAGLAELDDAAILQWLEVSVGANNPSQSFTG